MTFQYFFGIFFFALALDYFIIVAFDGLLGIFYQMNGDKMIKMTHRIDR